MYVVFVGYLENIDRFFGVLYLYIILFDRNGVAIGWMCDILQHPLLQQIVNSECWTSGENVGLIFGTFWYFSFQVWIKMESVLEDWEGVEIFYSCSLFCIRVYKSFLVLDKLDGVTGQNII